MDTQLQKYYEDRFSMMATEGWKDLIVDVKAMLESTDKVSIIKSNDDLWFRKGEISIMNWLLTLQEQSETAYKDLTQQTEGD